ncbi:cell division protein FtsW [Porphyrobacter algicida]|uniref:Probable peptidoglycan glycosyltransferase FtsW n=2 Tax=Qipengyuania algicida TaxID=1836209 RepID=A0A845AB79_9SPHN|nr:putative peptidoglycan glycosyltransferase FtsW [Qipengyuania algicida]MXP27500.1 cell division protein FtsW [Qipengyuania algicida]
MSMTRPYVPRSGYRATPVPSQKLSRWLKLKIWWREVDRVLLLMVLALMVFGAVAVSAASPASAKRLSTAGDQLSPLYFFTRNLAWQAVGIAVMIGTSMLSRQNARRISVGLTVFMLFALFLVPILGHEVNGARRWIDFGIRFQPSEFLKPVCAVTMAWILSWRLRDPSIPVISLTGILFGVIALLLMMQPNLGDTILFAGFWFVLILIAGAPVKRLGILLGCGAALLTATYFLYDNARHRIDSFFGGGTAFDQVDLAQRTILAGGWFGSGYGLGIRKMTLPEAHTDYIFSVIGEEFGLIVCVIVVLAYLAIVARVLMKLIDEEDLFALLAGSGLTALFGGQAFINILVNLQLFPSKGMTLPLISYGGSSTIAVCLTIGLLLAITKRNPFLTRETRGLADLIGWNEQRAKGEAPFKRDITP